jgi:DNA-binding CsgD family transcriptional regulator
MAKQQRQLASEQLTRSYAFAADLAERRREQVIASGDIQEASAWGKLAKYCTEMAETRATDDDQFRFQRDRLRQRDARGDDVLSLEGECDQVPVGNLGSSNRQLSNWAQAVIEIALMQLSPLQRVCFELVEGGLINVADVAAALNITPAQVRQHLARANAKMRVIQARIEHLVPGKAVYKPKNWYVKNLIG